MDMTVLREQWLAAIAAAADLAALTELDSRLFGPMGELLEFVRSVSALP